MQFIATYILSVEIKYTTIAVLYLVNVYFLYITTLSILSAKIVPKLNLELIS